MLCGRRGDIGNLLMDLELKTWRHPDGRTTSEPESRRFQGDPFAALRDLLAQYPPGRTDANRPPFTAGLVGYFGYETAHAIEHLPDTGTDDLNLPDLAFMVVDEVLVQDHENGTVALYVTGRGPDAMAQARTRTAAWQADLATLTRRPPPARRCLRHLCPCAPTSTATATRPRSSSAASTSWPATSSRCA